MMSDFDAILSEMRALHERKNHDYGSSFSKLFAEFGLLSAVVRLSDKVERLKTLCRSDAMVDESVCDTLIDLACYAVLAVCEVRSRDGWRVDKDVIDRI